MVDLGDRRVKAGRLEFFGAAEPAQGSSLIRQDPSLYDL